MTAADRPVRPADEPVRMSASALTAIDLCPARWFLEREAGGVRETTQAQGFGSVVHELADRISRDDLPADAAAIDGLMAEVDAVWAQIPFRTPWSSAREREEVRLALQRFVAWHTRPDARTVLATEQSFETELELRDGQRLVLHGYADRLELDADGHVVVVDLKTGKYPAQASDLPKHPQLGLYQLAVDHGAFEEVAGDATSGGAELWQLRLTSRTGLKVQAQAAPESRRGRAHPRGGSADRRRGRDPVGVLRCPARRALQALRLRDALPDPGLGDGAALMTRSPVAIDSPADLRRVMNADFEVSEEQWAAIRAPLEPAGRGRRRRLRQDDADGGARGVPRGDRSGRPGRGARPDVHHQGGGRAAGPDP